MQPYDGYYPLSRLTFDTAGNLYGTTQDGGANNSCGSSTGGCGTVFVLTPTGGGLWTENVLFNFDGALHGANPQAGLTFGASGNLYGMTPYGDRATCMFGCGTVFEITP